MNSIPLNPGYCTLSISAKGLKKGIVNSGTKVDLGKYIRDIGIYIHAYKRWINVALFTYKDWSKSFCLFEQILLLMIIKNKKPYLKY